MNRRNFLRNTTAAIGAVAAAEFVAFQEVSAKIPELPKVEQPECELVQCDDRVSTFPPGSREDMIMRLFNTDQQPKAVALARSFVLLDIEWAWTPAFTTLALGPFGKYVNDASDEEFNRSDAFIPEKRS